MLSEQQIVQFNTFGFLLLRNMLTEEQLKIVHGEFESGLAKKDRSERIAGARVQLNWSNLEEHSPFIASLMEDRRFYGVAQQLLGEDAVGLNSNSNLFSGDRSPWHPDVPQDYVGLKFTFYLSALDGDNGALRVIPGSHQRSFSEAIGKLSFEDDGVAAGLAVDKVPCHICASQPGDAVLFDFRLWHASWRGSADRRMVSLQYVKNPRSDEERFGLETAVRAALANRHKALAIDRDYPPFWLANAKDNPDRARWITQLRSWGLVD